MNMKNKDILYATHGYEYEKIKIFYMRRTDMNMKKINIFYMRPTPRKEKKKK